MLGPMCIALAHANTPDQRPDLVYRKMVALQRAAHSLRISLKATFLKQRPEVAIELSAEKPSRIRISANGTEIISDGLKSWVLFHAKKVFMPTMKPPALSTIPVTGFEPFMGVKANITVRPHWAIWRGHRVVGFTERVSGVDSRLFVDPVTCLPTGFQPSNSNLNLVALVKSVSVRAELDPHSRTEFTWTRPEGWTSAMDPVNASVGSKIPDFTLAKPDGTKANFEQTLKGRKAVILNFWFCGCGPCRGEFPDFQKLYEETDPKDLGILAVNEGNSPSGVAKFAATYKLTIPIVLDAHSGPNLYGLLGIKCCPTTLIVGPDRTILARFIGPDIAGIRAALLVIGVR